MSNYIKLMRIKHWIKNFLIFIPLIFNGQFFETKYLVTCIKGYFSFCLISSIIYIINDICDIEKDKKHPTKCNRPLASGAISKNSAIVLILFLLVLTAIALIGLKANFLCYIVIGTYFVMNLCYSMGAKNLPIVDITILAIGFVLRVLYGGIIINIPISNWLLLTIFAISFYLGLGKRRNEMMLGTGNHTRKVLESYNYAFLDKNMHVFLCMANIFYALWSIEYPNSFMVWTVPFIWIICLKYSLDIERTSDGDPIEVLLKDRLLFGLCFVLGMIMLGIIYQKGAP